MPPLIRNPRCMAKKWTNKNLPGALHFVTGNVVDRKQIFNKEQICRAFLEELQNLRQEGACKLIAFVLMLEHFHMILNPRSGDIQSTTGILKSISAQKIVKLSPNGLFFKDGENQVWQESFKALPLWSRWMIDQKINYIHGNPVKANLCDSAEDYRWTGFRSFYRDECDPLLAIDKTWWWDDDDEKLVKSLNQWEHEKKVRMIISIERNRKKQT